MPRTNNILVDLSLVNPFTFQTRSSKFVIAL